MNILDRQTFYDWQRLGSREFSSDRLAPEEVALAGGRITCMVKNYNVSYLADYWNHADHRHLELSFAFSGKITSHRCDCAGEEEDGACLHLVAFYDYLLQQPGIAYAAGRPTRSALRSGAMPEGLPEGFPAFPAVSITHVPSLANGESEIAQLAEYYRLWTPPVKLEKPVDLIPIFTLANRTVTLSLKIGADKTYVVKSISVLLLNVKHGRVVYYGKKLNFANRYENFTNRAQLMLTALASSGLTLDEDERYVTLSPSAFLLFLSFSVGQAVVIARNGEERPYLVTNEETPLPVTKTASFLSLPLAKEQFIYAFQGVAVLLDDRTARITRPVPLDGHYARVFSLLYRGSLTITNTTLFNQLLATPSEAPWRIWMNLAEKADGKKTLALALGQSAPQAFVPVESLLASLLAEQTLSLGRGINVRQRLDLYAPEARKVLMALLFMKRGMTNQDGSIVLNAAGFDALLSLSVGERIRFTHAGKSVDYLVVGKPTPLGIKAEDDLLQLDLPPHAYVIAEDGHVCLFDPDRKRLSRACPANHRLIPAFSRLSDHPLSLAGHEDEFAQTLYPYLQKNVTVDPSLLHDVTLPEFRIATWLSKTANYIELTFRAEDKNGQPIDAEKEAYRDLLQDYCNLIASYGFGWDEPHTINNLPMQVQFLRADLAPLKEMGPVYIDENLSKMRVRTVKPLSSRVTFNVNLLSVAFQDLDYSNEELYKLLAAYRKKKFFVKLNDDTIVDLTSPDFRAFAEKIEDLGLDEKHLAEEQNIPLWQAFNLESAEQADEKLKGLLRDIHDYRSAPYVLPNPFAAVMRGYQREAHNWLRILASYGFGGILADDMGLGKSLEMISLLALDDKDRPTLIACPSSLVYNWAQEINKWIPSLHYELIVGAKAYRKSLLDHISSHKKVVYITSYDTLREDIESYHNSFRFVILDEAQFIKNEAAQKSRAVKKVKAEVRFALTGTPIENTLADLWSIFDFLMPRYLGTYARFKERYESAIMGNDPTALAALTRKISPFILRRTKKDVLKDLPDKIESISYVTMAGAQKQCYESYLLRTRDALGSSRPTDFTVLSLLMRLRQICVDPHLFLANYHGDAAKLESVVDIVRGAVDGGHRILIFSQFKSVFPALERRFSEVGITSTVLTGDVKSKERMDLVEAFNAPGGPKVFLISLKAGGTGLNLTAADIVIHLDPWWNEAAENQASDRAHRIGQKKVVQVIKMICSGSIEEKVLKLQQEKSTLASKIIGESETRIRSLSEDDLKYLLS